MPAALQDETVAPAFGEALRFWWKLGWISFGGTAAHIAIMHDELVVRKRWIGEPEFLHALSHCMMLPGPEATQLAIYIGRKLHGVKGGVAAGTLFVLPSTAVLLALSVVYVRYGSVRWITAMIYGLRSAIVALVTVALLRVARRTLLMRLQWIVAGCAFVAFTLLHVSLPLVMLAAIAIGVLLARVAPGLLGADEEQSGVAKDGLRIWKPLLRGVLRVTAVGCALWVIPLIGFLWNSRDFSFWWRLSTFFTRTAFVTIGGSYTVLPYVAHEVVTHYHWVTGAQMLDGFSLAETTPGPLIIVVAYIGFMAAYNYFHGAMMPAVAALFVTVFYTFLPCFVFVFAGAPVIERTHGNKSVQGVLRLITAVVVAAMLTLVLFLARGALFSAEGVAFANLDVLAAVWVAVSFVLLQGFRVGAMGIVGLSLVFGLVRLWIVG
ncbi:chromate efflux transporter [Acidicapsa dinghuensis]|uniref:Chromate efflux transporter n=1 Tax=Acidicapsa dinghuensis TaxID=2218256 RepID=A0ABW1EDU5_9BACT|nr:chromate efflux transporter [Acidicapsa dinghuensis]